jgi:coenzyme F420-0:L-glutamate ligase / coenzyme F420-1:gamma-L-glutamate ligase
MDDPLAALADPTVVAFLSRARVAHLATADADGQPHVVPITFALHDGRVYSALDAKPKRVAGRQLRRVRNIQANPRVSVVVDHYAEDWSHLGYVLLIGTARLLETGAEADAARAVLHAKYPQYTADPRHLADALLIVVEPTRVVCWGILAVHG